MTESFDHPEFPDRHRRRRCDHAGGAATPTRSGPTSPAAATRSPTCPPSAGIRELYFSADHAEPDKTYSTIGGWVRDYAVGSRSRWKLPIPPKVADQMDDGQRWAISAARSALVDAGWPDWNVDPDNVAVIIGNAIGGEKHYKTNMRIELPEVLRDLESAESFAALCRRQREHILDETRAAFLAHCGEINEDTMPGELANVIAGRVANLFNFRGPNFTTDAACASGLAAMSAAVEGLVDHRFDAAVTGGIDHNMGVAAFVKFCKIGALSATGTRPFDAGADGFVMGEGAALFVLKRLEDAERDGDRVYAVILGIAGSSDGKGKGITAPEPDRAALAVSRAWSIAGVDPGHGVGASRPTARRPASATPPNSRASTDVFGAAGAPARGIALGSVKSNIGHLKAAAGCGRHVQDGAQPARQGARTEPELQRSEPQRRLGQRRRSPSTPSCGSGRHRRAGVRRGRGERVRLRWHELPRRARRARARPPQAGAAHVRDGADRRPASAPTATVLGSGRDGDGRRPVEAAATRRARARRIATTPTCSPRSNRGAHRGACRPRTGTGATRPGGRAGRRCGSPSTSPTPPISPASSTRSSPHLDRDNPALFRMLRQQGVFVGRGAAPKVAFLYTGQGSQYVNMLARICARPSRSSPTRSARPTP